MKVNSDRGSWQGLAGGKGGGHSRGSGRGITRTEIVDGAVIRSEVHSIPDFAKFGGVYEFREFL